MIHIIVLGAAAGGGFPQWNSNSEACRRARSGDPAATPATQASIAVSADGNRWFLINAAPDLREQINREPSLHPKHGLRSSPVAGVVLTNGDVDAVAGLLHLRERTPFVIYAHPRIFAVLDQNPIFRVLAPGVVKRQPFGVENAFSLCDHDGKESGLEVTPFQVPGKVALYMEDASKGTDFGTEEGDTIGLEIADAEGTRVMYVANCAGVTDALKRRLNGVDLLFFDGTLWRDDEMITSREGQKTGRRMGHISMSGEAGAMASLSDVDIGQRVFIHINNTNPALIADSPERREIESSGWKVAHDGMRIDLP